MTIVKPSEDNITMVAFHGCKSNTPEFATLVESVTDCIHKSTATLGLSDNFFTSYSPDQIHATVVGMEVVEIGGRLWNANYLNNDGALRTVDPLLLLRVLESAMHSRGDSSLFTIRFGGFPCSRCTCHGFDLLDWPCPTGPSELHSFGGSAYERSFYGFRGGPVMLTGWPVAGPNDTSKYTREVYDLRRAAGDCGFLDKYHLKDKPHWRDDDFYVRLGTFDDCSAEALASLLESVRGFLSRQPPTTISVKVEDICIVYYEKPDLAAWKEMVPLVDAIRDPHRVQDLYDRWSADHPS